MNESKECGQCQHWYKGDHCAVNYGEIYATDEVGDCECFLDRIKGDELKILQGHIQRKEREVDQLQKLHKDLTGSTHIYFK